MAISDIRLALDLAAPGTKWGWSGGQPSDYSQIVWRDVSQKPTEAQLQTVWDAALLDGVKLDGVITPITEFGRPPTENLPPGKIEPAK